MLSRVLLWMSLVICVISCSSQGQIIVSTELKPRVMSTIQNTKERAYMSRMYALFYIIAPEYLTKFDSTDFLSLSRNVNSWIDDNEEQWKVIAEHLSYCDSLRKEGQLGTDIEATDPDIRWRLFIEHGASKRQLTLPDRYVHGDTVYTIWLLIWPEFEIPCWSRSGQSYPDEVVLMDNRYPMLAPIRPFINYSKFPSIDSTTDVWFSVWIPGDQLTGLTLDQGQLSIQIQLYDSTKKVLVSSSMEVSNLQTLRGVLKTVSQSERRLIRAMGYVGLSKIEPGKYNARWTIKGASCNEGEDWIEVIVPSKDKVSDLLVLGQSMDEGDNVLPGIIRGELTTLYDNPECRFLPKSKLDLYFETTLPKIHGKRFEVFVTLLPILDTLSSKSDTCFTGKFTVVADSLDQPFMKGEWKSSQSQKLLDDLTKSESFKMITLLKKRYAATEDKIIVRVEPRLPSNLAGGLYLLTLTVTNPDRWNYFLSARRVIRIELTKSLVPRLY